MRPDSGWRETPQVCEEAESYVDAVDADVNGYFDTILKDRLLLLIKEHISDSRMLKLTSMFLDPSILEELREWTPIAGVSQGAVLLLVLSNLYLNPLDHLLAESSFEMVRCADPGIYPVLIAGQMTTLQSWVFRVFLGKKDSSEASRLRRSPQTNGL
jgi:retron-type reverse transcriptase